MLFGGNDAPLAYLELTCVGLPTGRTDEYSAAMSAIERHLDLIRVCSESITG